MTLNEIPDPRIDPVAFQAWALLYLDHELEPRQELEVERILVESPEAAALLREAAEMDISLVEAAAGAQISSGPVHRRKPKTSTGMPKVTRIPSLQSGEVEALDPTNQDDMKFVAEACTDVASGQERDRSLSQRHDRIARGWRRYWLQGVVAAGVMAAVTLVIVGQMLDQPGGTVAGQRKIRGANTGDPGSAVDENFDGIPDEPGEKTIANYNLQRKSGPSVEFGSPEHEIARKAESGDQYPENEALQTGMPGKDGDAGTQAVQAGSVDPRDAARMNESMVWLPLPGVKAECEPARARFQFKRETNPFTRDEKAFGGMLYLRPLDPARGPSLKVTLDGPLFSSQMDFQFVLVNKLSEGKQVKLSPKDFLPQIRESINLQSRKHTFEIIVKKFNRYELRFDGVLVNHTEPLLAAEWPKLYLGFIVSAPGNDTETLTIERVTLGGEGRESRK